MTQLVLAVVSGVGILLAVLLAAVIGRWLSGTIRTMSACVPPANTRSFAYRIFPAVRRSAAVMPGAGGGLLSCPSYQVTSTGGLSPRAGKRNFNVEASGKM